MSHPIRREARIVQSMAARAKSEARHNDVNDVAVSTRWGTRIEPHRTSPTARRGSKLAPADGRSEVARADTRGRLSQVGPRIVGPVVIAVRGPSRSGKTTMCEQLVSRLGGRGLRVAWLKRTHHAVDAPGKSSDRVWLARPSATMLRAADRLAITLPACSDEASD